MKTKTIKAQVTTQPQLPEVTSTTRSAIGQNISFALDMMNDPRFRNDGFRQIEDRQLRSYALHAENDEVCVHFVIEWKGGKR